MPTCCHFISGTLPLFPNGVAFRDAIIFVKKMKIIAVVFRRLLEKSEKSCKFAGKRKTEKIMKIVDFYPNRDSLSNIDEPYKGALYILNILYMKAPQDGKCLDSNSVIDYYVMSCVRTIAEELTEKENSFPSVFQRCKARTYWSSINDKMDFNDFRVNADYEQVAIFGAIYYVLKIQGKVKPIYLDFIEETFSSETRLKGYFQPFKDAAEKVMAEEESSAKKNEAKKMTPAQAGLFCEVFLNSRNCTYKNKKKKTIPPLASSMFGWAISTMERSLAYSNEDKKYVADLFKDIDPEFSELVRIFEKKEAQIKQ